MVETIIQEKWKEWKCSAVKEDTDSLPVVCSSQDVSPSGVLLWVHGVLLVCSVEKSTGDSKYSDRGNH